MKYPALLIDENKLRHNVDFLAKSCHDCGVSCDIVTKVTCAHPLVVSIIENSLADGFADSRIENLESIKTKKRKLLLRISALSEAERVVAVADASLQSELSVIAELEKRAGGQGRIHGVILMIDLGDLREGLFFENREGILKTARFIAKSDNLMLLGLGTNLTCFGAILPDEKNLGVLCELASWLERELDIEIPLISGGNSSSLSMLFEGRLPKRINHLRIGEAAMLGQDTASCKKIPELYDDAFVLAAEIVEVQKKPAKPIGTAYKNAFGESVEFSGEGEQTRAILAVGRQDVVISGLTPLNEGVSVLGGSSDHLIVSLENGGYRVGDILKFKLNYGALLAASTSKYVYK
ncbi:MAG: alanine/ornithine racemase family PLP-dependent enzyme [Clostridia bacterium]|nr:alanine/ornithine racemase family PLP-dependent enzyme [Clostridia bacterium]